jgi:hypothetical protein
VTECQGCGAWNDTSRTLCVLCGTPLAETDEWDVAAELPPLPPLPDGGLQESMPSWLREPPAAVIAEAASPAPVDSDLAAEKVVDPAPLGPHADPRTFLSDDDFPQWLRDLAVRREGAPRRSAQSTTIGAHVWVAPPVPSRTTPDPDSAPESASGLERTAQPDVPASPSAVAAPRSRERCGPDIWQTLLLVVLFIGVIAAALWALFSNGVLSTGL